MPVLLVGIVFAFPLTASASSDNGISFIFQDYIKYKVSGDVVNASAVLPDSWYVTNSFTGPEWYYAGTYFGRHVKINPPVGKYIDLQILPLGGSAYTSHDVGYQFHDTKFIDIRYLPSNTELSWGFELNLYGKDIEESFRPLCNMILFFVDADGVVTYKHTNGFFPTITIEQVGDKKDLYCDYSYTFDFSYYEYLIPSDTVGFVPYCCIDDLYMDVSDVELIYSDFGFSYSMSSLEYEASQNAQLKDTVKNIQDSLDDQKQAIDELPDKIGDQMQNVMDTEKENSKNEGNKFVDQILDKLPDPSQGILDALGELTSAVNYTGTDASLQIPAIVLPGIEGLFPETEIWGGTEFSFSTYVQMLPYGLVTLVQSLFTIAIVLFCVYELKGIISYCLTLREKDGG